MGSKLCATKLRELCVLCERKNSPANLKRSFSHGGCVLFLMRVRSFSHRKSQKNRTHRVHRRSWPLPLPLPQREGRDHRDTPIEWILASLCPLMAVL